MKLILYKKQSRILIIKNNFKMNAEDKIQIISKLKSVRLCLESHPHNEPHSEFADRISDLSEIIEDLENNNLIIQSKQIFRDSEEMIFESKMNIEQKTE